MASRPIEVTPEWQPMFRFAIQLVKQGLPVGKGQALVVEMLEFGARCQALVDSNLEMEGFSGN